MTYSLFWCSTNSTQFPDYFYVFLFLYFKLINVIISVRAKYFSSLFHALVDTNGESIIYYWRFYNENV